jgi:hypothetical protein
MNPKNLKALIESDIKAGIDRVIHVEGSPGLGKTEIPGQVAASLGIGYRVIHAPMMQPEDYGFPIISADKTDVSFIASREKFPFEDDKECPERGILLVDESPQADTSGQKVLANLFQAREIHGRKLKKGWKLISTGNRVSDRAGANRLLSHLRNKITTVHLEVSLDDWTQWALQNGVAPEVIFYCRYRPEALNEFDPQKELNPTPRAWVQGVSARLKAGIHPDLEFETYKGDVGEGRAAEFVGFVRIYRKLPSPDAILLNPAKAPLPTIGTDDAAAQTLYALCGALAHKTTPNNFGKVMVYVSRMPGEFVSLFVKNVIKHKQEIATSPDFIHWASTEGVKILG